MAERTTADLIARAQAALAADDAKTALAAAAEVLRFAAEDHAARVLAAHALMKMDRPDDAVAVLRAASDLVARRGYSLPAIAALREALAIYPDDLDLFSALGDMHGRMTDLPDATRAHVLPPHIPRPAPDTGSGSLLRFTDDEARLARALELLHDTTSLGTTVDARAVPLFSDLSKDAFVSLIGQLEHHHYPPDTQIVSEGDIGDSMFIVISGEVDVHRGRGGARVRLARLAAGSLFGEMALVTEQPRSASVKTVQHVEAFEINVRHVEAVAKKSPTITKELVQFARRRMLNSLLTTSKLFAPFDMDERRQILSRFRARVASKGEVVIRQNDHSSGLFVVAAGRLDVTREDEDGNARPLAYLKAGDVFGEIALLVADRTTATVTATEKSVLLHLDRNRFSEVIHARPEIEAYLEQLAEKRLDQTDVVMKLEPATVESSEFQVL